MLSHTHSTEATPVAPIVVSIFLQKCVRWYDGRDSMVSTVTRYCPDSPGNNIFRACLDQAQSPPSLLYNGYQVFPRSKVTRAQCLSCKWAEAMPQPPLCARAGTSESDPCLHDLNVPSQLTSPIFCVLCSERRLCTNISGLSISPIFEGQGFQEEGHLYP